MNETKTLAEAALKLIDAYAKGEASGGSIDWTDLGDAFSHALIALAAYEGKDSADALYQERLSLFENQDG